LRRGGGLRAAAAPRCFGRVRYHRGIMTNDTNMRAGVAAICGRLRRHYEDVILPMWMGQGFDAGLGLPYEALHGGSGRPLPPQRYRAMACARQLYVYAEASALPGAAGSQYAEHAARLFDALARRFANPGGGWYFSVDAHGAPLDDGHDLYSYAFVIFASAAWYRRGQDPAALAVLRWAVECVERHFRTDRGLYWSRLGADGRTPEGPVLQNPIMHLTEAYLAAREVDDAPGHEMRLRRLAGEVAQTFLHSPSSCIAEAPVADGGIRLEPGHQFEWYALVKMAPQVWGGTALERAMEVACSYGRHHGVDPATQGVCLALDEAGAVVDATQRIWAQTEFARALALRDDGEALALLRRQLGAFEARFLHAGGWHECVDAQGGVTRADMPSTTPYHLATCYAALPR
jgi:mannose-6-phosphate isomerase